ncbi:MAG: hypothetical protein ACSHX0_07855 [Akkermansiaceae bacterium]
MSDQDLKKREDLTRWNRAGLSEFRYVDGNALTYLEMLRCGMVDVFSEQGVTRWKDLDVAIPDDETQRETYDRITEQYTRDQRGDYAWEILRTFSRTTHVLTEHLNAYANEGYLKTAKEWEHVRRLVDMIGYHPAPPASATTKLALLAKEEKLGEVLAGFQVKNEPIDGAKAVIFETLEDITVDERLNQMMVVDWDVSQEVFVYESSGDFYQASMELAEPLEDVSVGSFGVLIFDLSHETIAVPVLVTALSNTMINLLGSKPVEELEGVKKSNVRLLLSPEEILTPKLFGDRVIELDSDFSAQVGSYVAWLSGENWVLSKVLETEGRRMRLSTAVPSVGKTVHLVAESVRGSDGKIIVPVERHGSGVWDESFNSVSLDHYDEDNDLTTNESLSVRDEADTDDSKVLYLYLEGSSIGSVSASGIVNLEFSGSPGDIASRDWVLAATTEVLEEDAIPLGFLAAEVVKIAERDEDYSVELLGHKSFPHEALFYTSFSKEVRPKDYNINKEPADEVIARSDQQSVLFLDLEEIPAALEKQRLLVASCETASLDLIVKDVSSHSRGVRLVVEPALTDDFLSYATAFYGNVVSAGHGETKPTKVLGSGDATKMNQEMVLKVSDVSFVTDASMSSGVRAGVQVFVDGQTWQQTASLADSEQEDSHYTVRMTEDGFLAFKFGDGYRARRLPTGRNNVKVSYRVGVGLAGNLFVAELKKAVKPHPLLEGFQHLTTATGGNNLEDENSLRENAPSSILALERAVSLNDFSALAVMHSGVWQAKAFHLQPGFGYQERVRVAAVPAGGGELGDLAEELIAYLQAHAAPDVEIQVSGFRSVVLDVSVSIQVKSAEYEVDVVTANVQQALLTELDLKVRKLGVGLFRSELFAIVEGVLGVENCTCLMSTPTTAGVRVTRGPDGVVRSVRVKQDQVIYLDEAVSLLSIEAGEYVI